MILGFVIVVQMIVGEVVAVGVILMTTWELDVVGFVLTPQYSNAVGRVVVTSAGAHTQVIVKLHGIYPIIVAAISIVSGSGDINRMRTGNAQPRRSSITRR